MAIQKERTGSLGALRTRETLRVKAGTMRPLITSSGAAAVRITKRTIRRAMDDDFNGSSSYEVFSG